VAANLYFAYGANMDKREMQAMCRQAVFMGAARLDGWRLAFTYNSPQRGGGIADIIPLGSQWDTEALDPPGLPRSADKPPLSPVWGVLWQLTDRDLQALHKKEGYSATGPREAQVYGPVNTNVLLQGTVTRRISAFSFHVVHKGPHVSPSSNYMHRLLSGAAAAGLPSAYTSELAKVFSGRVG
jgi:hypothetical protein